MLASFKPVYGQQAGENRRCWGAERGFGVKEEKMGQVTVALRIGLPNSTSEADQSDTHLRIRRFWISRKKKERP
ncbi:zinc finger protein WIP3 [Prunus yedoensis var. nudiflora]|uniref:Zinc finger protein WIP3 n=1 Tax=Prunus yedoensis var. nudiflora TaxID=2094558 RepID=A0A314Z2N7_PRUYE|nr:zinc finger protein WIP3 [Prunus yedoensis var. nudiflora]